MIVKKKVNIESQYPLYVFTPPLTGVINGAELTYPEIYNCLGQGAIINEILSDGSELRLNYQNYDKINIPKININDTKDLDESNTNIDTLSSNNDKQVIEDNINDTKDLDKQVIEDNINDTKDLDKQVIEDNINDTKDLDESNTNIDTLSSNNDKQVIEENANKQESNNQSPRTYNGSKNKSGKKDK